MSDKYLMDSHKLLWHLDELSRWKKGETISPIYMEISPVSFCNHKCIFCGVDYAQKAQEMLSLQSFDKFIFSTAKSNLKSLMFAGDGEPLLHPDLSQMILLARNHNLDVSLATNGSLLTYSQIKSILPNLTWIRFSVDAGNKDTHAVIHQSNEDEFSVICENIKNAVRFKKEYHLDLTIGVQVVVIPENINELNSVIEIFSSLDVDYISFKPFSRNEKMIGEKQVDYSDNDLKILRSLEKRRRNTDIICRYSSFCRYSTFETNFSHCLALPFWAFLAASGDVYTCGCHTNEEIFYAGNINNNTFEDIMYGTRRKQSIAYAKDILDVKQQCRVNCRMTKVNEFLEHLRFDPKHVNFI